MALPPPLESRSAIPASRFVFIAGPTAVGKSAIAMALAGRIGGEIVSVDSMQVYLGLDLGTAKPSPDDRQRVPHHLIDLVEPNEPFDAAQFAGRARDAVAEIQQRGRFPILCGGSGLYFKAFFEGLGEAPGADPAVRAKLESTSLAEMLQELEVKDPACYARIDRNNKRRVVRALEVIRLTGKPFPAQPRRWNPNVESHPSKLLFGLTRSNDELRARIDARVDAMFALGLIEETKHLLARGLAENKTAMQAIGYRQAVEFLRGERTLSETIALVKLRTRQLAKRQMTWFRRQCDLDWIHLDPLCRAEEVAEQLFRRIKGDELE